MSHSHRYALRLPCAGLAIAVMTTSALATPAQAPKDDPVPPNLPFLVGDLRTDPRADGSDPMPMRNFEVSIRPGAAEPPFYFTAVDDRHGRELWRLRPDGSPERLTDVCAGPCDSFDEYDAQYVATLDDGRAIFTANDGETGQHLWISDGTESGTQRLTPRLPGPSVESIGPLPLDGYVYFSFRNQLWRTDGTPAGTSAFDTDPATIPTSPRDLLRVGDRIVFWNHHFEGQAFWAIDGTAPAATRLIDGCPDFCRGSFDRLYGLDIDDAGIPHKLVFPRRFGLGRRGMTVTDGTPAGTQLIQELCPGGTSCLFSDVTALAGDHVAFRVNQTEVWRTDGTLPGTQRLADLTPETWVEHLAPTPEGILAVTFFSGQETLWHVPLAGSPSRLDSSIAPGRVAWGDSIQPSGPFVFSAQGAGGDYEVWRSDGSPAGTRQLADIVAGADSSSPSGFRLWNGQVYFSADDRRVGRELYTTDSTVAGTMRVADLRGDPDGSRPSDFVDLGGRVLFLADVTNHDPLEPFGGYVPAGDLFTVVGSTAVPILEGKLARDLTRVGNRAFFVAQNLPRELYDRSFDFEPWITDGTPTGTYLLKEIAEGRKRSYARDAILIPTPQGERILFFADQDRGAKIWISDGTPSGTELLTDIHSSWDNVHPDEACTGICSPPYPPTRIYPRESRRLGDLVVFIGREPTVGEELWITDGTASGTRNLLDVAPGNASSYPEGLVVLGDSFFFTTGETPSDEHSAPRVLWVTDASGEATQLATDLGATIGMAPLVSQPASQSPRLAILTHQDVDLSLDGYALWVSDGTPAGTERIAVFEHPLGQLTAADGLVYFTLETEDGGRELARSDGTSEGTFLISDLYPGNRGSSPTILTTRGREVVFSATDGTLSSGGTELWISNGESGDVRNLSRTGARLQAPTEAFFADDGRLYVSADDGILGHEPWVIDVGTGPGTDTPTCSADPFTLCLADRFKIRVNWSVESTGASGPGRVVANTGTADTGFFWFFDTENVELAVKVLDGTEINDHHWLYYGALSDVRYTLVAEDLLTGTIREFTNPRGNLCGDADIEAFPHPSVNSSSQDFSIAGGIPENNQDASPEKTSGKVEGCGSDPGALCLQNRFEISVDWQTEDASGRATAVPFGEETGMFWFFTPNNVELLVKILDGRSINDKFWIFYGALSDVAYAIRVVDTETGVERFYDNELGNLCGDADIEAFDG